MSIDLTRFHQTFFEESFERADQMEEALLKLDTGAADPETINTIFRAAHSIKGGAATFGFSAIAEFTHGVETLLDEMRAGKREVTQLAVDLFLRSTDVIRGLLGAARSGDAIDADAVASTQQEISAMLASASSATPAAPAPAPEAPRSAGWRIRFEPQPGLFLGGNDPLRIFRSLSELGTLDVQLDDSQAPGFSKIDAEHCHLAWTLQLEGVASREEVADQFAWVEDECKLELTPLVQAGADAAATAAPVAAAADSASSKVTPIAAAKPAAAAPAAKNAEPVRAANGEGSSIRVGTEKIDTLINLVGELVITQAMLAQLASQLDPVQYEKLLSGLSQLDRNTRELQEAVLSTRMLPMENVFSRFPRLVRDLAGKLGKQVRLATSGEHTELDKSVIEKIVDPLNHLVRNCLDHGLESSEERLAAGKDRVGTVRLSAAHQGGTIVIEVSDDGRGINRQKVLAKAQALGMTCSESMSDADLFQLIFAPGFSTADQVTDVSGRGVGMDVVKRNIQALGGSVELASTQGQGTTFTIRLPLTLAILDGMSVAVGGEIFFLPLSAVVESMRPQADQIKRVVNQQTVIRVRQEYLPVIELQQWFQLGQTARPIEESILVLVESEGRKVALQVDDLVGQQQVVIKSLENNYRRVPGVSGATISGDGRVALILDVADLVRQSARAAAA